MSSPTQPFPASTLILKKQTPLWDHGVHDWTQIIGREPNGRPYFLDDREFQWANPSMGFPLPQDLTHSLKYLRTLFSSKSPEQWRLLTPKVSGPEAIDPSIAPHWWDIFAPAWGNPLDGPSPLAVCCKSSGITSVRHTNASSFFGNIIIKHEYHRLLALAK